VIRPESARFQLEPSLFDFVLALSITSTERERGRERERPEASYASEEYGEDEEETLLDAVRNEVKKESSVGGGRTRHTQ
jgi:hypothetical protein